jgi:hypothetical protein
MSRGFHGSPPKPAKVAQSERTASLFAFVLGQSSFIMLFSRVLYQQQKKVLKLRMKQPPQCIISFECFKVLHFTSLYWLCIGRNEIPLLQC